MDGITVVVFLVRCAADLLSCDTVPTEHLRFQDMQACHDAMPALIAASRNGAGSGVSMATCRYRLDEPDLPRVRQAQAPRLRGVTTWNASR